VIESAQAAIDGLQQLLVWPTLGYLVAGVIFGFVVGVLPGLGGPAALAFLLPIIVPLAPLDGFVLLTATAAVTASAGDMTSILLGVPGEATAAAIVADGHALARRGEARYAIGAALTASFIGALVGLAVLIAFIPVAPQALRHVGSPELAGLALVGICLLVPLSNTDPVKGLLTGALGLALAMIGLDPFHAEPRFTFAQLSLWDGLGILPVALGLFAIAEALEMIQLRHGESRALPAGRPGILRGVREAMRQTGLVSRCSAIGAAIGTLPGVGAAVTQWIAYAHTTQTAKDPDAMGSGAIEGVIGPASATTATHGGALVPMLALGIPGGLISSFLLSALVLKGIAPGPAMLQPGGQLALVFSLVWCTVIASAIGALVGCFSLGWVAGLAALRPARLFPVILTFVLVGTVGERHSSADLLILLALGGLGYTLAALRWPRAPLMLGFVLGPLVEERVLVSNTIYGWSWVLRPTVLALAAVTIVMLAIGLRAARRGRAGRRATRGGSAGDLLMSAGLAAASAAGILLTVNLTGRSSFFPRVVLGATLVLALVQLMRSWRGRPASGIVSALRSGAPDALTRIGWFVFFVMNAWLFGLTIGCPLSVFAYLRWGAHETWRMTLTMAAILGALTWLIVVVLLQVSDRGVF
jgi:putative tricarboxylic transport membrane protein